MLTLRGRELTSRGAAISGLQMASSVQMVDLSDIQEVNVKKKLITTELSEKRSGKDDIFLIR